MKSKIKAVIGIGLFLALMIIGVFYFTKDHTKKPTFSYEEEQRTLTRHKIIYGSLASVYDNKGRVCADFNDNYLEEISQVIDNDSKVKINVGADSLVEKNQDLFSVGDKIIKSPGRGRIIDIKEDDGIIKVIMLNYDKISVCVSVPLDVYEKLNKDTEVKIKIGSQKYDGYIDVKGYELVEDSVNIYVKSDELDVIPGVEAYVTLGLGETEPMLYVSEEAVETIDGLSFIYLKSPNCDGEPKTENDLIKERVATGRVVTIIEGENHFNYVELLGKSPDSAGDYIWR